MDFLTEVDKLVQLIECPIFTCKAQPLPSSRKCAVLGALTLPAPPTPPHASQQHCVRK